MDFDRVEDLAEPRRLRPADARKPKAAVPAERLSELIGSIYDCAIDPGLWEQTLLEINRAFSFASAVIAVSPLRQGAQVVNVSVGCDVEWLARQDGYGVEGLDLWGGPEQIQKFPLDEPIIGSQLPAYKSRQANRYYRDILAPRGLEDAAVIAVAREPMLFGYVAFNRHVSAGLIDAREAQALRILGPHFRRAVTISNMLDMKSIEAATFSATLDALSVGVLLVDEKLGIVHANAAAQALLATQAISAGRGTLALQSREAQAALETAVRQAMSDEAAMGHRGIGVPAGELSGEARVVHVMPLERGATRRRLDQRAVAALFIAPAAAAPRLPADALALLYDLTPAETRIFELVCAGITQEGISADLGIAKSTVKTHMLRIFEKTGCNRQVDLVKLAARFSLAV